MICPPCALAADLGLTTHITPDGVERPGHNPAACRDHAVQPHGCPCQHRPHAPQKHQEPRT